MIRQKETMDIKAVVFDFDGVCIDTETARFRSWQQIYASYGFDLPLDEWIKNIGRATYESDPFPYLEKLAGEPLDREAIHKRHQRAEVEIANGLPLQPGLVERLEEAAELGISCAIASSSSYRWVGGHLDYRSIIRYFRVIICREDTERHKPDPQPYATAVSRLDIAPVNAVAVEDSAPGIASANAAGLFTVAVPCPMTMTMDFSAAGRRVTSLKEISWRNFG